MQDDYTPTEVIARSKIYLKKTLQARRKDKGVGAQKNRERKWYGSRERGGWGVRVLKRLKEDRNRIGLLFTAPILKVQCLIWDRFL